MKTLKLSLLALSLAGVTAPAMAYESGDVILRLGPALVAPDSKSSMPGLGDVVEVEDGVSLGISGTYMVSNQVGVEVLGALPFEHGLEGTGALAGVDVGTTEHLPPTVLVNFYPAAMGRFQPFVGAGLNYTTFFNEETSAELDEVLGGRTTLELTSSKGLALELGCDVTLNDNVVVSAAVWDMDIDTTARVNVDGNRVANIDVAIDPTVYMLGIGMKF